MLGCSLMAAGLALTPSGAGAAAAGPVAVKSAMGTVKISFQTPVGVAADLRLRGKVARIARKSAAGTSRTVKLAVPPGTYSASSSESLVDGIRYVPRVSATRVVVRRGKTVTIKVTLVKASPPGTLQATSVTTAGVSLEWQVSTGTTFQVRRGTAGSAPASVTSGTLIAESGTSVTDPDVTPGASYAYTLFVRRSGGWFSSPPVVATVPTVGDSAQPAVVVDAASVILTAPQAEARLTPTSSGNAVYAVPRGSSSPALGAGMLIPPSADYPDGALGKVAAVAADGRTVTVTSGSIPDVFDYFDADLDITGATVTKDLTAARIRHLRARGALACKGDVTLTGSVFTMKPGGHFRYSFKRTWGVITGVDMDIEVAPTFSLDLGVAANASASCELKVPSLNQTFMAGPIPMALKLAPVLKLNLSAKASLTTVTASVRVGAGATASFPSGSVSGRGVFDVQPLKVVQPQASVVIGVKVGGTLTFGPGAATGALGATAGIKATVGLVDSTITATTTPGGQACVSLDTQTTASFGLTAKVWAGPFSAEAERTFYQHSWPWTPDPVDLPHYCASKPTIVTGFLPTGEVGVPYNTLLAIADDRAGTWTANGLPTGLAMAPEGVISGTPTGPAGDAYVQVTFTDDFGHTDSRSLPLTISADGGGGGGGGGSTENPAITLDMQAGPLAEHSPGAVLTFTYQVVNAGDVPLGSVGVGDPKVGPVSCPASDLPPGAAMTCVADYYLTQSDIDAGVVQNTGTAHGISPAGTLVVATDSLSVPLS